MMRRGKKNVGTNNGVSFCQIMREIYYSKSSNKKIRMKCRHAAGFAKNIVSKLSKYKEIYMWDKKKYRVEKRKMSIRKHKPISVARIEKAKYKGHHTICQFLRDIYAMTDNEEIKLKCRIGVSMAKSMHVRLKKYRKMMNAKEIVAAEGDVSTYEEEG